MAFNEIALRGHVFVWRVTQLAVATSSQLTLYRFGYKIDTAVRRSGWNDSLDQHDDGGRLDAGQSIQVPAS